MRYTQYRGLAQVTNWVKLKFAAMNLKKLATWKWKASHPRPDGWEKRRIASLLLSVMAISPTDFFCHVKKPVLV